MDKINEFMNFLKKNRTKENEERSPLMVDGLETSDGKSVGLIQFDTLKLILSGCTDSMNKGLGVEDLIDRMTKNFIKSNTEEDLEHFCKHHVALKIANLLS